MAVKQQIRKVQAAATIDFDDQQWPINVALVILGAFVAGVVMATSDFSDPRVLYNGWVRMLGVALTMGLLFGGVAYMQRKVMRRVQLCVLLSLLFHLWLALYLHQHYLRLLAQEELRRAQQEEAVFEQITVPEYNWEQIEQPETRQSFEEPVPTEDLVDTEPDPLEQQEEERPLPTEDKPEIEPAEAQRQEPSPAELNRAELSAPRRADVAAGGQVSRQEWKQKPLPNEPIPQPEVRPPGEQPTRPLADQVASVQRRATEAPRQERQTFEEPASERQVTPTELARNARQSEPSPEHPATPAPSRQLTQPAEVAQTEAAAPEPVRAVEQPQPAELNPATEMATQRQSDPSRPIAGKQAAEPTPVAAAAPTQRTTEHRRVDPRPELAQAPQPSPTRRVQRPEVATEPAAEAAEAVAQAAPAAESPLQPAEPALSRQTDQAAPARAPAALSELPANVAPNAVAESRPRRATREAPTPSQQPSTPSRVARQVRAMDQPAPSEAAPAAVAEAATPASAAETLEAATIAMDRAPSARAASIAPVEAASQALPAASDRAQIPTAVARRAQPSQPQPSAEAPSTPAQPTTLARNPQGVQLPSTAIPIEGDVASAAAAPGSAAPSQVEAASQAAAVMRSATQAPQSTEIAAAGAADLAVGAGQIVTRTGQPRAADVSRPSLAETSPAPRPARATAGMAVGATPTPEIAPEPSAVAARTGGPPAPAMAAPTVAAARSGQASLPVNRPSPVPGSEADTGAATPVGASQPSRVTRYESTPDGLSGGGTPSPARSRVGQEMAAEIQAEPTPPVLVASGAGGRQGSPLEANVRGEQRQVAGLPGSERSSPMAGAVAAQADQGAALPVAVARRAAAAQTSEGAPGLRPDVAATLARAPSGIDLPTTAAAADQDPSAGAGGVAAAEGAAASALEPGEVATVARGSAASAPAAERPVAEGSAEFSVGAAQVAALTGQLAASGQSLPEPAAAGRPSPLGRTPSAATIPVADIADVAPGAASPAGEAADAPGEPAVGSPATELARAAGSGLPSGSPTDAGAPAPAGTPSEVEAPRLARRGSSEVILASAEGSAVPGPQRAAGRLPLADALADTPAAAPMEATAGEPNPPAGGTLQAAEVGPQRQTPGLPGNPSDQAAAAELAAQPGPAASTPGTNAGPRRLPEGDQSGPELAAAVGGAPLQRSNVAGLPRGLAEAVAPEAIATVGGDEAGEAVELTEGAIAGEPSRQEGGLPVQIAALPGPGGLSFDPALEVGIPSRRANRDSEVVHNVSRRFVVERSGGELAIDGTVNEPTEGFRHRNPGRRAQIAQARGGSEGTERAVEMGLDFLARIQFPDGRWRLHELPPGVDLPDPGLGTMQADTAATGLALLTYLGAGYTHLDDKHRTVVDKGLAWLVRNQKPNGDLFTGGSRPAWFYSHGIATIALCEAYGMTQDPGLREPAQRAVQFICQTQHPTRGGWRYDLDAQGRSRESDTSVSGWQLMALKSAQMAGLEVPSEVLAKVGGWLDLAQAEQAEQAGQYVYNPYAADSPEQRGGRSPNLAMTAEGMLMRIYLGRSRDNPRLADGADFLRDNPPEVGTAQQPRRDCYYWYYATQAMFQMQEPYWTEWNDRLRPLMESGQEESGPLAGSWHPLRPVPDRWGHAGGRLYVTAMHLLMLEVYYRHLPLFQELSR